MLQPVNRSISSMFRSMSNLDQSGPCFWEFTTLTEKMFHYLADLTLIKQNNNNNNNNRPFCSLGVMILCYAYSTSTPIFFFVRNQIDKCLQLNLIFVSYPYLRNSFFPRKLYPRAAWRK